jgi:hypothetical protein
VNLYYLLVLMQSSSRSHRSETPLEASLQKELALVCTSQLSLQQQLAKRDAELEQCKSDLAKSEGDKSDAAAFNNLFEEVVKSVGHDLTAHKETIDALTDDKIIFDKTPRGIRSLLEYAASILGDNMGDSPPYSTRLTAFNIETLKSFKCTEWIEAAAPDWKISEDETRSMILVVYFFCRICAGISSSHTWE